MRLFNDNKVEKMNTEYTKKHAVTYTELNQKGEFSLVSSFNLLQNVMTEYFESFKSDNLRLKENNNAIWVVTKTKIHFNKYPIWRELVKARGYTTKTKPIRIEIETNFEDAKTENLFIAKQECCVIDLESRKLRKIDTVDYPKDMKTEETKFPKSYLRLREEFSEKDYVYKRKVYSSDIDYSRHTNNVAYVKYIANTLPSKFFEENQITDFEIHYINESKEGQVLKVYKKDKNNSMEFLIKNGDDETVRASLNYVKIYGGK